MKAKIKQISRGKEKGQFRFVIISSNNEPIAQSWPESYTTKQMCLKTVKKYFPDFEIEDCTK